MKPRALFSKGRFFYAIVYLRKPNTKKGEVQMKKLFLRFGGMMAAFAYVLSVTSANGLTGFFYSQPPLPEKVKALRKF